MSSFQHGLFVALLFFFSSTNLAIGQTSFANKAELEKAANDLFVKQDYSNAKPLFSQLLSQDALNADYNYRFGVCIMYTEADPAKPMPYIEGGASGNGVNPEAFYFLGLVYRFNYRFDESAEAFLKAKAKGFTASNINLDRETQISRNGRLLYNDALVFQPSAEKDVIKSEFYRPYDFRKLKGKVIPTPPNFKSKYDEKTLIDAYIYAPTDATALVYASYGETGATGRDLYRVNKLPNGEFGIPQRLPDVINTVFDEDFAFLDESSNTLFFSSKGHNTMGGFDVFSSRYDLSKDVWSVPMNLQYPTNSPFDDFLYITDPDNELAYFTSSRKSAQGMVKVFKTVFFASEQLEMTVVEGRFEDATDNELNYLEIEVTDPETKEVIGNYRSQILSGKYIMILPPKMGYMVDVAPRGAKGFRYMLDVPKRDAYQTIRQSIVFSKTSKDGDVKITNYFGKAGQPDTIATVITRPFDQIVEQMPKITPQTLATAKAEGQISKQVEARAKAEEEKQLAAKKAEEARLQAETQAKAKAEQNKLLDEKKAEEARIQAETQAKVKAEQDKLLAEKKAKEARIQAETQVKAKAEQNKLLDEKKAEEARLQAETQAKIKAEQDKLLAEKKTEEARLQAETQVKVKAEQDKLLAEKKAEEQRLADDKAKADVLARMDSLKIISRKPTELKPVGEEAETAATKVQLDQDLLKAKEQAVQEEQNLKLKEIADKQEADAERKRLDSIANTALAQAKQMAANESSAAEQEKREREAQDAKLRAEQKQAILQLKEDLNKREQQEKDLAEAKLQAEIERKKNALLKDTMAAAPSPAQEELTQELEKAKERAAKASERTLIEAKELELAEVQRKAEIEKEREVKDALNKKTEERRLEVEATQKRIEVEKFAEVALRDAQVAKERNRLDSLAELEAQQLTALDLKKANVIASERRDTISNQAVASTPKANEVATNAMSDSTQGLSDTELFMVTVAKLEAQRKTNDEQVKRKASQESEAKAKAKVEQEFARIEAEQKSLADAISNGDTVKVKALEAAMESARMDAIAARDTTPKVDILKSNADPEKYLADMLEAERKIADDAKRQTAKDYTLKPMPELARQPEQMEKTFAADTTTPLQTKTDKALETRIEEDRRVVDQHQALAKQQEEKLREQMQRDRDAIAQNDTELLEELKRAEQNAVKKGKLLVGKSDTAKAITKEVIVPRANEKPVEIAVAPVLAAPNAIPGAPTKPEQMPIATAEVKSNPEIVGYERTKDTPLTIDAISAADAAEKTAAEQFLQSVAKAEANRNQKEEQSIKLEESVIPKPIEKTATTLGADTALTVVPVAPVTKEIPVVPVADSRPASFVVSEAPSISSTSATGETKASNEGKTELKAALRDYSKRTADYNAIADKDQRVLVQRMAAEDRGRLAVQKQVNNAALTDAKSAEKLEKLQRTQDVLAKAAQSNLKEKSALLAASKEDVRRRKDMEYRIALKFPDLQLSEHVLDALDPEYAAVINLASPTILIGRQLTLADARSELGQLTSQGFGKATILALQNGSPISLENTRLVPFID